MFGSMHGPEHGRYLAEAVEKFWAGVDVDQTAIQMCMACGRHEQPGVKLMRCSQCKVVRYRNAGCAKLNWKGTIDESGQRHQPHRDTCLLLKKPNLKLSDVQVIAKQFPWARQQSDGTFFEVFLGSKGLLGSGAGYGWWTQSPCCNKIAEARYMWGFFLLEEQKHIRERAGWKLPDNQIPWLDFAFGPGDVKTPEAPPCFEHTWASYYEWRGLPMESPAVLLLHWPLTLYRVLYILGLAPAEIPADRRELTVHVVGIEKELDFLPVFGELALLFPNADLHLVLFGQGVADLLDKARRRPVSCIARQRYVYSYTAPKVPGSGCVHISLSRTGPFWDGKDMRSSASRPDAMVGFNPGLATCLEWKTATLASCAFAMPFAVTDYQEISMESNITLVMKQLPILWKILWDSVQLTAVEQRIFDAHKYADTHAPNPFMSPGPRTSAIGGGPSAVNGFEMVITPGINQPK